MPPASSDEYVSLWDFSLSHYARAGVADACLRLQDEHGVNVNLLLWCAWLERRGLVLDGTRLRSAQKRIHAWDEHYVIPLRQLRRRMKAEFGVLDVNIENLRSQIKSAELLAEKQVHLWLEAMTGTWENTGNTHPLAAGDNLRFYLQYLNVTEAASKRLLDTLGGALI